MSTFRWPAGKPMNILVVGSSSIVELKQLNALPSSCRIIGIGRDLEELSKLTDEDWQCITVVLRVGYGTSAGTAQHLQDLWPKLSGIQWLHSAATGVEKLLFPELRNSDVVLTNAKGCFSNSLAEYVITACLYFAKDIPRLQRAQMAQEWSPYVVGVLRGKTIGIVGYGAIGSTVARLAGAFGMNVIATKRKPSLEQQLQVQRILPPEQLCELMAASDYVVCCLPLTPATLGMVNGKALAAMKPSGVLINIGRGQVVDEDALLDVLQRDAIRGAALDVFCTEPLPAGHALWSLPNVLLSPHTVDNTETMLSDAVRQFMDLVGDALAGRPVVNVVDKAAGY